MIHTRLFAFLFALLAFVSAPAAALDLPARPQGPIYDETDLIPADREAALDQTLRAFDAKTGDAVIVATVASLQGDTIEGYAQKLYAAWGIGGAERDTGVLLLIAPSEHKMRIEVGYGLTPYITDILSGRIIRDDITPRFKQGDFPGGIEAGVNAMLTQLSKSPEDAKAIAEAAAAAEKNRSHGGGVPIGGILWVLFILFFFILPMFRRRKGRHYGSSGIGNVLLWSALNAATHSDHGGGWGGGGGGGFGGGGGGGGFGGFGGGMSGGGGASGGW